MMSQDAESPEDKLHPTLRHHIVNSLGWPGLRPVQRASIGPILDGDNVVILAPTAGGKTEAAFFPLLSQLLEHQWPGLSVLYLSPLRALLNNQAERLERLFGMIGHKAAVWHGDVGQTQKDRLRQEPPSVLLTTPESLEAMLISTKTHGPKLFGALKVVVIDEVHAFAGADRGWHLLGVLQRLQHYAGYDVQRIGLSATVGNKQEIVSWLSAGSARGQQTIDPKRPATSEAEVKLDWVASLENAALVIRAMHRGEKRLVFCDSRIQAEQLTRLLRGYDVPTHIIHGSLSGGQRAMAEAAFTQGGEGVIVATSALELGIDIGDLDRVINIDAPMTVASFLQRMGRTGRRPGTRANMLMLAVSDWGLVRAAALLELWSAGFVEDVQAPSSPLHIFAQQALALAIEQPGIDLEQFKARLKPFIMAAGLDPLDAQQALGHLLRRQYLHADGIRLGVGARGERELGAKHYLELVSVFTTPPLFTVMHNRQELGTVDQSTFAKPERDDAQHEPMIILLAGRSWRVRSINWSKKIAYVEPIDLAGKSRWVGPSAPMTGELARSHREVLLERAQAKALWSKRAHDALTELAMGFEFLASDGPTLVSADKKVEYWSFAGTHHNQRLAARLEAMGFECTSNGLLVTITSPQITDALRQAIAVAEADDQTPTLEADHPLAKHIKFHGLLPDALLVRVLAARMFGEV